VHHHKLILFDFDGVIVNGIDEYWFSSKLACEKYLFTNSQDINLHKYIEVPKIFVEIRPWVKYGWEMVLIAYEILKTHEPLNNLTKSSFLENYEVNCSKLLLKYSWKSTQLQQCLDDARVFQINNDLEKWISLHRPFHEVVNFINYAKDKGYKIGVISTKGKTFTSKILSKLNIFPEFIFGYESGAKVEIIANLTANYEIKGFVEDRRKTLLNILQNNQTKFINCYLAEWGYLKNTDKIDLPKGIKILKIKNLKDLVAN
tara:strand:- start:536 stop:1312 length:777 start_codon:yes stop_codon:yes gene_type:complete